MFSQQVMNLPCQAHLEANVTGLTFLIKLFLFRPSLWPSRISRTYEMRQCALCLVREHRVLGVGYRISGTLIHELHVPNRWIIFAYGSDVLSWKKESEEIITKNLSKKWTTTKEEMTEIRSKGYWNHLTYCTRTTYKDTVDEEWKRTNEKNPRWNRNR